MRNRRKLPRPGSEPSPGKEGFCVLDRKSYCLCSSSSAFALPALRIWCAARKILGALFRDDVSVRADSFVEPRLDVTTRVVCSFQAQRSTPLLAEAPGAFTEEFSEAPDKQALWKAFRRKGRLEADNKHLGEVVTEMRKFLMPPTTAAVTAQPFRKRWRAGEWLS